MTSLFPHLLEPIQVGGVRLRNRIFSSGHMTCMLSDGLPNADFVAYHEARAAGGCGLIITESAAVHPTSNAYNVQLFRDDSIAALSKVADAVHRHDCKVFGQLGHGGRETHSSPDGTAPVAFGPSQVASERFHVIPRAMPRKLIVEIGDSFGAGAERYLEAGFDGVEIMASHGLLLAQFLNPRVNRRVDEYGGELDNRMRLLRDTIASVRKRTGSSLAVGIRISGDELNVGGLEPEEVVEVCARLNDDGELDFIDVIGGSMTGLAGSVHVVPPMNVEPGYLAPVAAAIKSVVAVPVLVAGRINQPHTAESILAAGHADLCGMTRAQICDPELADKAARGAVDDIRACIGCNQACIGHMQQGFPISCIQHPETGRERRYGTISLADESLRVVVAGGGPAGMKAAAVAAARGHHVTLYEQDAELGGQVKLARLLPERAEFGGIITNLDHEMRAAGARVELGVRVDRALIVQTRADAVVLATGGAPHIPDFLIEEGAHVVHATQLLAERANVGARVVVADWRCDWVGLGIAEQLARDGCYVRLAVNGYVPGESIQQYVRDRWVGELHRLGVDMIPYARLVGVDESTVYLQHTISGEPILCEDVDTLVAATGNASVNVLERELEGYGGEIHMAGDCLSPRTCEEAVLEGLQAALAIGASRI
ncbi:MAG: FAD-dependent oxidoreductase [Gammaproteobacteria bacterium]|nr:FAD-dependent oxidoreductase [Gammaproteobacteria bacterium]